MYPEAVSSIEAATSSPEAAFTVGLWGLLVLSAIPVAGFALWADYFERYVDGLKEAREQIARAEELYRLRIATLFAMGHELAIYIICSGTRSQHPFAGYLAFLTAILAQALIQARLERKIRGTYDGEKGSLKPALRAFAWSSLAGAVYLAVLCASVALFCVPAVVFHAPPVATVAMIVVGIAAGVMGGLAAAFALSPVFVRKIFAAQPIEDAELRKELSGLFSKSGLRAPNVWVIDPQQFHVSSAMVTGFDTGKGWFTPALFLSKSAIEGLTPAELHSVVLHEISHLRMKHLRKRFVYSSGLVLCASLVTGFTVQLCRVAFPADQIGGVVGCATLVIAFSVAFRLLAEQSRYQEIAADIHSIDKLGSKLENLSSALRKIDRLNDELPFRKDPGAYLLSKGHPQTELRIRILEKFFELRRQKPAPAAEPGSTKKAA